MTLPRRFFERPAPVIARELLGMTLVSRCGGDTTSGWIVETEAYLGREDPASHAFRGRRTAANAGIWSPPGSWYVYRSYGIHWCCNLVTGPPDAGAAVLLRAVMPREGLPTMRLRRRGQPDRHLTSGPGKLCQALGITRALNGVPMASSEVVVRRDGSLPVAGAIRETPRIGISKAVDWPLRYVLEVQPRNDTKNTKGDSLVRRGASRSTSTASP